MSSWTDKRPMSPHTSIWKWHITMAGSILHRATGIANYVGAFLIVGWLFMTTLGQERYDQFAAVVGSIPVQVLLFGWTLSICYHILNGIRHLTMDAGVGFRPKFASFTASMVLIFAIALAAAVWIVLGLVPGFDPLGMAGGA
jgi:succinate dehydrogenase / fumarate reductase, cytochrome b subunit